jgi:hypothetical protein
MKKLSFFYGYLIIAACAGIQAIGIGTYVTFGVFFKPLLAEFDWSRTTLSGAHSLAFLIAGIFGIIGKPRGQTSKIRLTIISR